MRKLAGKVAIITGGAGGIGQAAGALFASEGAQVLLVDLDDKQLQQVVDANEWLAPRLGSWAE